MITDWSMSLSEADGLILIFIDLNVPALTPRPHFNEAALQLSGNTAPFEVCCIYTRVIGKEG
jgi:hypothetical protein